MKLRFYVDVPDYAGPGYHLFATNIPSPNGIIGWKRVAFDVDMPPEVWKSHDFIAPTKVAGFVEVDP